MDTVEPKPLRWVWQSYIPRGKITVLDGDPGLGKSLVTIDLIARVTTGRPFPDGSPGSRGGCVLLTAEDDLGDTVRPRLEAAGADLSKVVALTAVGEGGSRRPPSLPLDIPSLRAAIDQKVSVLVVIDPLMAYLNAEVNSHRDQDVRGALVHVKELAESKNCAILLVRHLNKSGGGNPLYRGGGSIGIIAAARSGLLIAEDPDDQKARVFAPTKANLSRLSPALSYIVSVTESGVPPHPLDRVESAHRRLLGHEFDGSGRSERDHRGQGLPL